MAVAGGVGSVLRYLVDNSLTAALRARFPWGTMCVNLTGSLLLGLITGLTLANPRGTIMATGLLGGYTTLNTASLESIRLLTAKRYTAALLNGPGMLIACATMSITGILITTPDPHAPRPRPTPAAMRPRTAWIHPPSHGALTAGPDQLADHLLRTKGPLAPKE